MNAYYAMHLLGEALGSVEISKFGATLAAMEILSAQQYYHMYTGHSAVGQPFSDNKVSRRVLYISTRTAFRHLAWGLHNWSSWP